MNETKATTAAAWAHYWAHVETVDYINITPRLLHTLRQHVPLRGSRILEIGVGTGGNSATLAQDGATAVALDLSPEALRRSQATARVLQAALLPVHADALRLPFAAATFDLIFHQGVLEHFTDPAPSLREQARVLRPGGWLLVDVPQRYNLYTLHKNRLIRQGRWPYGGWECSFSLGELRALLRSVGFTPVAAYGRDYYPRPWAMLRRLARVETKLLRRRILPAAAWRAYDALWDRFEASPLGCYTLQSIGVLARKT